MWWCRRTLSLTHCSYFFLHLHVVLLLNFTFKRLLVPLYFHSSFPPCIWKRILCYWAMTILCHSPVAYFSCGLWIFCHMWIQMFRQGWPSFQMFALFLISLHSSAHTSTMFPCGKHHRHFTSSPQLPQLPNLPRLPGPRPYFCPHQDFFGTSTTSAALFCKINWAVNIFMM